MKKTSFGEANILLYILTEDLGLIIASARSARLSVSKLRPALQEYAFVSVSCIKGKGGWKITNVVEKGNFFFDCPKSSHKVLAQVTSVLLKMIQGETPHKEVFQVVRSGFEFLKSIPEKSLSSFEILSVLRILYELGYVAKNPDMKMFLDNTKEWGDETLKVAGFEKIRLVGVINNALKESQM